MKFPFCSAVTCTTTPVSSRVSVPVRLQEPALPATTIGLPGWADPGLTEVMAGVSVTATVTLAMPQGACPVALRMSSHQPYWNWSWPMNSAFGV